MSDVANGLSGREYPQTWLLLEAVAEGPRLVGHEVVDLSPGAIELRHTARALRGYAEARDRWVSLDGRGRWDRLGAEYRRTLSFGPEIRYCVELDERRRIHGGRPVRHLGIRMPRSGLTPATSAEIGLYFYGRRPAVFGFVESRRSHGFIGFDWEPLDREDAHWLLEREMSRSG